MHGFIEPAYTPEDEEPMHTRGWGNVVPRKPKANNVLLSTQEQVELARAYPHIRPEMRYLAKQQGLQPMNFPSKLAEQAIAELEGRPVAIQDPVTKVTVPSKYYPTPFMEYQNIYEWTFEEIYPVQWGCFESNTQEMRQSGWDIKIELNMYTHKYKLVFREEASGLMCRVPFEFNMEYIDIPKLYAVKSYRLKPAKHTETVQGFTKEMIPEMLKFIRASVREEVMDYVLEENSKRVVPLREYLLNRKQVA